MAEAKGPIRADQRGRPLQPFWSLGVRNQTSSIYLESLCGCKKPSAVHCAVTDALGASFSAAAPPKVMGHLETQGLIWQPCVVILGTQK